MARYIDADKLVYTSAINLMPEAGCIAAADIERLRGVDAIEVVRCKDCVFWGLKREWLESEHKCLQLGFDTGSMFFCGFAEERRDKNADSDKRETI